MTKTLLIDPPGLRNARKQLAALKLQGRQEITRLMSLAECNFRIAVHPESDSRDSIELLRESMRLDGSNPKYAYHLGRVHLLRGEFELAARWFRLACCLVPTSHRIWAHISVLLRELNSLYYGNEAYEANVLRDRGRAVAKAIREGQDAIDPDLLDFVPPKSRAAEERETREIQKSKSREREDKRDEMRPSKIQRRLDSNQCRWSGLDHLFIEQTLEGRATQANLRTLVAILSDLAKRSPQRPGRSAAVVILCIQWLIRGYPVESIRRILKTFPEDNASTRMLDHVCMIFEATPDEVPKLLHRAIEFGLVPPTTAALIHQQRLLWHSLEYRSLGTYRSAQNLVREAKGDAEPSDLQVANDRQAELQDLLRRIDRGIASMTESPPKKLKDETSVDKESGVSTAAGVVVLLEEMERSHEQMACLKDEGFRLIKEGLDQATKDLSSATAIGQCAADRQKAGEFISLLAETTDAHLKRCEQLSEAGALFQAEEFPDDFAARCESCVTRIQSINNLGKFSKVLKRIDKRISVAMDPTQDELPNAAAEWSAIVAAIQLAAQPPSHEASCEGIDAAGQVDRWEEASTQIQEQLDADWVTLKDCVLRHKSDNLTDEDLLRLAEVRTRFEAALESTEQRQMAISELRRSGTLSKENVDQIDRVEKQCLKIIKLRGKFLKNFGKLPSLPEITSDKIELATPGSFNDNEMDQPASELADSAPSADSSAANGSIDLSNHDAAFPPKRPAPVPPRPVEEMSPREQIEYALTRTDRSIDEMFDAPLRTLERYPEWIQSLPPFEALRRRVLSRQAETAYRLGNRPAARKIWQRLLRGNRLSADALKNIAVCDLVQGDIRRSLQSWRDYVELLYLYDILAGAPKLHAGIRAEFHRAIGTSYAPSFLSAKVDTEWKNKVDAASLISFLSSAGRFRSYIDHRLLEYLNMRFTFESPSLILGIKRVEAELHTDTATRTLIEYVENVTEMIPKRVRKPFANLVVTTFSRTADTCRDTNQLTLQATPEYAEEEKRQIELLVRMFDIKLKLYIAFQQNIDLVKNITSLDFLAELTRLDQIPLRLSPGLVPIVANTMGIDEEFLLDLPSKLRTCVVMGLTQYLLADDDDEAETPVRERQYRLLTGHWLQGGEFKEIAKFVDSPFQVMPERVIEALNQSQKEIYIPILIRWSDCYPAMASITVLAANALFEQKEYDEARRLLSNSLPVALHHPTRRQIRYLLGQVLVRDCEQHFDSMDYEAVLRIGVRMIDLDDFQIPVIEQILGVYKQVHDNAGSTQSREALRSEVENWIDRATTLAACSDEYEDELPRPTESDIEKARELLYLTFS